METEKDGVKRINPRVNNRFQVEYDYLVDGWFFRKKYSRAEAIKLGLIFDRTIIDKYKVIDTPIEIK